MTLKDRSFIFLQHILPQHFLSGIMLRVTRLKCNHLLKFALPRFIKHFKVNMDEAIEPDWRNYESFNAFFTRALKAEVRPFASDKNTLLCPVDGAVSQAQAIEDGRIFQAKGQGYSLNELLGGNAELESLYQGGTFATLYLSPRDYHRIHMPCDATLTGMTYVPGKLFSVNKVTAENVPRLFARNERVICQFDTEYGPMAMVLVGAIFVSSMETVWHGTITPPYGKTIEDWTYAKNPIHLKRGEEMGRFNMGSTVVMLFAKDKVELDSAIKADAAIQLGQALAKPL